MLKHSKTKIFHSNSKTKTPIKTKQSVELITLMYSRGCATFDVPHHVARNTEGALARPQVMNI
jgi:hypothetical protein